MSAPRFSYVGAPSDPPSAAVRSAAAGLASALAREINAFQERTKMRVSEVVLTDVSTVERPQCIVNAVVEVCA